MARYPPPEANFFLGQTLSGRYRVREFINSGNFSLVFRAEDQVEGDRVAVKVLKPMARPEDHVEFDNEAHLLETLKTASNVLDLRDIGADTVPATAGNTGLHVPLPTKFMVLELAEKSLADIVVNRADIDWLNRLLLFRGVAKGTHQMHLRRVVHRDGKADNVLLVKENQSFIAKIGDLGRSKSLNEAPRFRPEDYLHGRGDLRFAPPEFLWLLGDQSADCWLRADLYQLGAMFFELGTGIGLTALIFGDPRKVASAASLLPPAARSSHFRSRLAHIGARFEAAYAVLYGELPASIRYESLALVRALTHPDPRQRGITRFRVSGPPRSLEWVLRRVDIITLQLKRARRQNEELTQRKRLRKAR